MLKQTVTYIRVGDIVDGKVGQGKVESTNITRGGQVLAFLGNVSIGPGVQSVLSLREVSHEPVDNVVQVALQRRLGESSSRVRVVSADKSQSGQGRGSTHGVTHFDRDEMRSRNDLRRK